MVGGDVDEDPIKVWQDPHSHPPIPDHIIMCPLGQDDLEHEYYSLTHQGVPSFYLKQEKLLKEASSNKPLTMPIPTSSTKKAKKAMAPLAPSTLDMRVRVMREFIGFCAKWLHLPPTMEHVLNPQVVAKYMGFHLAKGNKESTLHLYATHLHQVASTFVSTTMCPKALTPMASPTLTSVMAWYVNLVAKLLATSPTQPKAKSSITLWGVWQACLTKWSSFQHKLNVRSDAWRGGLQCAPTTHHMPPNPMCKPLSHQGLVGQQGQVDQELG